MRGANYLCTAQLRKKLLRLCPPKNCNQLALICANQIPTGGSCETIPTDWDVSRRLALLGAQVAIEQHNASLRPALYGTRRQYPEVTLELGKDITKGRRQWPSPLGYGEGKAGCMEGVWIRILTDNQDSIVLRSMLKGPKQLLPFGCYSFRG